MSLFTPTKLAALRALQEPPSADVPHSADVPLQLRLSIASQLQMIVPLGLHAPCRLPQLYDVPALGLPAGKSPASKVELVKVT